MKLEVSLFRFDKNSDYLPYYTKHFLKISKEKTLLDILNTINENETFSYKNSPNFNVKINNIIVKASTSLETLTKHFGNEFMIEPISIKRAFKDLLINEDDFYEKLELLSDFIDEEDKKFYKTLKPYYYASNTLNYEKNYAGDGVLLLAYELIQKNPSKEEEILKHLKTLPKAASFHTSLKNLILEFDDTIEEKINTLQEKLNLLNEFKIETKYKIEFGDFIDEYELIHNFKGFNLAYYSSKSDVKIDAFLQKLFCKFLKPFSLNLKLPKNTFLKNPTLTYKTASTILLDAFDNAADILIVDNKEDFYIFDSKRKELEKVCQREIPLPVLHINELQKLAIGKHKEVLKTLQKHQINPEII